MRKGLMAFFLLFSACSLQASEVELTLLHTGDTHGRGMSEEGIGYGKISAYVKTLRNNSPNVLLLDVGDAMSGMPVTDLALGEPNVRAMNTMAYDAFTPGNADFIFGGPEVLSLRDKANFPFVSANIHYQNKLAFRPFIIKKVAGLNIAIIGVSPLNAMVATTENKLAGFSVSDPIKAVQETVAQVKDQSDLIIVLAHIGKTDPDVNIMKLVAVVPEIDVLVDGHDHIAVQGGKQMGKTVMVNAGQYGDYLGQLRLTVKDKKIVAWNEKLLDVAALASVKADGETQACIDQAQADNAEMLSQVVMTLPFTLDGERKHVRSGQTNLGSVMADAEREYTKADIAFTVGAFLRDSIQAGPVTYGQVLNALPFRLPLVTREMTGQQIKDFIEHNYLQQNIISGAYAHVSGMTFTVDFAQPAGSRMTAILVNGKPLALDKTYRVACNEQVSDFGIREIAIRERYDVPMATLLTDYINKHPTLSPPTARVNFIHPAG
ncbi:bifunctional UDP-sugar hydrolase/5'-nucleotidase [Kosakonia sp. H02]|nr:bifunctional UDP-sugar hydrolase/5'-nucleotidase [Kosakonia sp. H02]